MKASEILSFFAGAAAAAGITLLFTTDKGKDIREKVASRMTKEEIDKVIEKLKNYRKAAPSEEDPVVDEIFEDEGSQEMED